MSKILVKSWSDDKIKRTQINKKYTTFINWRMQLCLILYIESIKYKSKYLQFLKNIGKLIINIIWKFQQSSYTN